MIDVNAKYGHMEIFGRNKYTFYLTLFSKICLEFFEIYISIQNCKNIRKRPELHSMFGIFGLFIKCDAQIYMSSLSPVRL